MTLVIYVNNTSTGLELRGFPFAADQFIESELVNDVEEMTAVYIPMEGAEDTTAAQEQYLNTNPHVLSYKVVV